MLTGNSWHADCVLRIADRVLRTAYCVLRTAYCVICVPDCQPRCLQGSETMLIEDGLKES